RKDAALYDPAPPPTGKRGRPAKKGKKLPKLADLARTATFTETTVHRYGKTTTVHTATINCLWYTVFGPRPVTVTLLRENQTSRGYDLALVTTDPDTTAAQTIQRYACRWAIEVCIEDAKQLLGVGQAHTRPPRPVERPAPFGLPCQTLTPYCYATAGHHPDDVTDHRARRPWYTPKTNPPTADILTKLRRALIATKYRPA